MDEILRKAAHTNLTDAEIANVLKYASRKGLYQEAGPIAKAYAESKRQEFDCVEANFWALDVLRKAGCVADYFEFFYKMPDRIFSYLPLFTEFAEALHDKSFLDRAPRSDLIKITKVAVNQKQYNNRNTHSYFLFKSALYHVRKPQGSLVSLHQSLVNSLEGELSGSKAALVRLHLDMIDRLTCDAAIEMLNGAAEADLYCILNSPARTKIIRDALAGDEAVEMAADKLSPHVLLAFDKYNASVREGNFSAITTKWVEGIWKRLKAPADLSKDRQAIDQIILRNRNSKQKLYDRYFSERGDFQEIKKLKLFEPLANESSPNIVRGVKKIAICLSGQMRGYKMAFPTIKQIMLNSVEYEIFIHTWRGVGRKQVAQGHLGRIFSGQLLDALTVVVNSIGFQAAQARHPNLFGPGLSSQNSIDELAEFYGTGPENICIEDDDLEPFSSMGNQDKMCYKIKAAHQLMDASGKDFDGVLRIRPDLAAEHAWPTLHWPDLIRRSSEGRLIFTDLRFHISLFNFWVGDIVAFGAPEVMKFYASAKDNVVEAGKFDWTAWPPRNAYFHSTLAHALWMGLIGTELLPVKWGGVLNPAPLSAGEALSLLELDLATRPADEYDDALLKAAREDAQRSSA